MTAFQKIQQTLAPELGMLARAMHDALATDNAMMQGIVDGYLQQKGKLIRPILVILAAKLVGEVNRHVISAAAAVEMLHNASLIHDDVVDESKLRRGHPTVNATWDNHIAVLVGDFFVSTSLRAAIETGDTRIISSLSALGRMLSLGEIDQIFNARDHRLSEEAYFSVISQKTASLFVSCVEMGAYAVGMDCEERLRPLREFAELLGQCFQIRDDIFDYFGDAAVGKPTGNDLREGKITLPLLHVLTNDALPGHEEMLALSRREEMTATDIDRLITYAHDHGGIDYAYARMEQLHARATRTLCEAFGDSEARRSLLEIFDFIIARSY